MTKRQESRLTMYEGIVDLLKNHQDVTHLIDGFEAVETRLTTLVGNIKSKTTVIDQKLTGKTATKYSNEEDLITVLLPVCNALFLFGKKQKDETLKEMSNTAEYKLHRLRDTQLSSFAVEIWQAAQNHAADLVPYGITTQQLAQLKTFSDGFAHSIAERDSSSADTKGARQALSDLFDETDELLNDELDRYFEILRLTQPELFASYTAGRNVKLLGIRHREPTEPTEPSKPTV